MGYTTDFNGSLKLNKKLTPEQLTYINKFSEVRHMKRDVSKLMELYKGEGGLIGITTDKTPKEIYGLDGEYYVGGNGFGGQDRDTSIIDYNTAPGQIDYNDKTMDFNTRWMENKRREEENECVPGLWCQWIIETPTNDEQVLCWDGNEKFYNYIEWLKYLIKHFFSKWDVLLNGEILWKGEENGDIGKIVVTDNVVKVLTGTIVYN